MSGLNKEKAEIKLKNLSWEELDWLEKKCKEYKNSAEGPRIYKNEEAVKPLARYFEDTYHKHHGY